MGADTEGLMKRRLRATAERLLDIRDKGHRYTVWLARHQRQRTSDGAEAAGTAGSDRGPVASGMHRF